MPQTGMGQLARGAWSQLTAVFVNKFVRTWQNSLFSTYVVGAAFPAQLHADLELLEAETMSAQSCKD